MAIPDTVTFIGEYAFCDCVQLTDVYYGGTADQWAAVVMREYNEPLLNAAIHFGCKPAACGDANGDGKISVLNAILLRQYLAGWDVTLGG